MTEENKPAEHIRVGTRMKKVFEIKLKIFNHDTSSEIQEQIVRAKGRKTGEINASESLQDGRKGENKFHVRGHEMIRIYNDQ